MTKLDTVSMSADRRSATRSMPTGAAHSPTSTTTGPESAATSSTTDVTSTIDLPELPAQEAAP